MENKINLEELIIRQLEVSLDLKNKFESKATGYLAVVALVISTLFQFHLTGSLRSFIYLSVFEKVNFVFFGCTFLSGLFVLAVCSLMLYPKDISYFDAEKLQRIYELKMEKAGEFDQVLLTGCQECIHLISDSITKLKKYNRIASFGLMIMVFSFVSYGVSALLSNGVN